MNLDELIAYEKRLTQYGNPASPTDQAAKDLVVSINSGLDRIATNWLWDWLYHDISISLVPGTTDYTLDTDITKIIDVYAGNHQSLRNISLKEYHNFLKDDADLGETTEGDPGWYLYIGRAASGARKIRIGDIPTTSTTLSGFGKLKLTRFSNSDLGTGKSMLPFPTEGESVLMAFMEADIYRLQGKKDLIFPQEQLALAKLKEWRGEEATDPSNSATSNLPAFLRNRMTNRRNGYVV